MKHWLPILVISSLIFGGCQTAKNAAVIPTPTTAPSQTTTLATSLKDLLTGGKEEKCTWTAEDSSNSNGTLYVSGKKFKQEINITDSKTNTVNQLYSLSDGTSIYSWGSVMGTKGFKISLTEMETLATNAATGTPSQTTVDLNKQYRYQCQPWTASDNDFVLPTNITFTDVSNQMKQLNDLRQKLGR